MRKGFNLCSWVPGQASPVVGEVRFRHVGTRRRGFPELETFLFLAKLLQRAFARKGNDSNPAQGIHLDGSSEQLTIKLSISVY
jgi:hypothetical protein